MAPSMGPIMDHPPAILIAGATASGKTPLAIALAQRISGGGECLCADSMQIYRDMNIGTAKPTDQELAAAPHHLLDLADPRDATFTVDRWLDAAEPCVSQVRSRGRHPILVGGTNLYLQAFLFGLCDVPSPDANIRLALEQDSNEQLRTKLLLVDKAAAEQIHPNDRRRTIRALEVHQTTGQPISKLQQQWTQEPRHDALILRLEDDVEPTNRRINQRVGRMMEMGFLQEVASLLNNNRLGPRARAALGYQQLADHLEGKISLTEAIEQIKIATRRFAKQQRTWLRRFSAYPRSECIRITDISPQDVEAQAFKIINKALFR